MCWQNKRVWIGEGVGCCANVKYQWNLVWFVLKNLKLLLEKFTPQFFEGMYTGYTMSRSKNSYNVHFSGIRKQVQITEIIVNKGQIGPDRGRSVVSFATTCVAGRGKGGKSKWARDPPASDLLALHALVFPPSFPFGHLSRKLPSQPLLGSSRKFWSEKRCLTTLIRAANETRQNKFYSKTIVQCKWKRISPTWPSVTFALQ